MANRNWANGGKIMAMNVSPVMITVSIIIGTTGAVSSFIGSTTLSVTRTGTGLYSVVLQPQVNFPTLLAAHGACESPSSGLSGVGQIEFSNNMNGSLATATGGTFVVKTLAPAGTVVDPASGTKIKIMLMCNNSNVPS